MALCTGCIAAYNQALILTASPSLEFVAKKTATNLSTTKLRYSAALSTMSNEYAGISGEIEGWPSKDEMCLILEAANLSLNVGKYAIRINDFDHFIFREFGGDIGSPCITAGAESSEELVKQSSIVSSALSAAEIKHCFEVYDGNDELVAYYHYNWPKEW